MYRKANIMFLIAETPMHAGSGDSLGIVDLPIQRERHTGFPKIEASSLKGALREAFESTAKDKETHKKIYQAFGFDEKTPNDMGANKDFEDEKQFSGCLGFSDARLLLFPVKSMKGVFAWITCPAVITKFAKDLEIAGENSFTHLQSLNNLKIDEQKCFVTSNNVKIGTNNVVLEEFTFEIQTLKAEEKLKEFATELAGRLFSDNEYWKNLLINNLVVLRDDDFTDFVQLSTEVITRTKIDNITGTVEDGALFTEEYLPSESILYSLVLASPEFSNRTSKIFDDENDVIKFFNDRLTSLKNIFQLGGNATLGKGILKTKFLNA